MYAEIEEGRRTLLQLQGAIGYLRETGVSLPEPEVEATEVEETPEPSTAV